MSEDTQLMTPSAPGTDDEHKPSKSVRFSPMLIVLTVLSVAGLVAAVLALVLIQMDNSSLNQKIEQQQARIQQLQTQQAATQAGAIAALGTKVTNLAQALGTQGHSVSSLTSDVDNLILCVPQLQQEMSGLTVAQDTTGGYVTNAYLSNPTIISSNCTSTLNGG